MKREIYKLVALSLLTLLWCCGSAAAQSSVISALPTPSNSAIGSLTPPAPPPAGCPPPPNNINFAVAPTVTFDAATGLYTYSYTVGNLTTSQYAVSNFAVDFVAPVSNVSSPTGWGSSRFVGRNTIHWAALGGDFPAGQDTGNIPVSPYSIAPGSTLAGFSFQSRNAPAGASDYVLGDAPLPSVSTTGSTVEDEGDLEDLVMQCDSSLGNFFDMAAVGYTLVPAGTVIPAQIIVNPYQHSKEINVSFHNPFPVAIISNPGFNASLVLPQTVTFGPNNAPTVGNAVTMDVNNDGLNDLVVYFDPTQTGLQPGDVSATLAGAVAGSINNNGQNVPGFQGSDWVAPGPLTAGVNSTEIQGYTAGAGDALSLCFSAAGPNSGGACFSVPTAASTLSVQLDDLSGQLVVGNVGFVDNNNNVIGSTITVCGSNPSIAVPAPNAGMFVTVSEALAPLNCPGAVPGTAGSITARFH